MPVGQRRGFSFPILLMLEWEYISISLNDLPLKPGVIAVLCDAGRAGWELVTISPNNIAYLKRQIRKRPSRAAPPPSTP
jgi:hypothetical protein